MGSSGSSEQKSSIDIIKISASTHLVDLASKSEEYSLIEQELKQLEIQALRHERSLNEEQHRFIGQMRKIGIQLPTGQSKTSVCNVETPETTTRNEFICKHQPTAPSMDGI